MAVARGFVEELFMVQRHQRAAAVRLQRHRDLRFPFRRRVPRPAERDPGVRSHFAIDAADLKILAIAAFEADAVAAADAQIDFRLDRTGLDREARTSALFFPVRSTRRRLFREPH